MKTLFRMVVVIVTAVLSFSQPGLASSGAEAEARAAFVKLYDAAKKQKLADFKKLIARADLSEMEAMEKQQAGLFQMMMGFIAKDDPKGFTAKINSDSVVFTKAKKQESKDLNVSESTKVTLVREDNQWKFGKPGR